MILLSCQSLGVSLAGRQILQDLDLEIAAGEVVGLIGPNGAGKSTLLKAMAGLLAANGGEVRIGDCPLSEIDRGTLGRFLAYLPQGNDSHWAVTVETLVMLGRLPHQGGWRAPTLTDREAVERALVACDVAQFRERPVTQLSGGERTRVLLARALAGEPRLLLADEPVAGLDPGHQLDVMEKLRARAAQGAGIVVVVHDLTLAARYCDRLLLLCDKRIAAEGRPRAVLSPDNLARCYGVRAFHGNAEGASLVVPLARCAAESDRTSPQ